MRDAILSTNTEILVSPLERLRSTSGCVLSATGAKLQLGRRGQALAMHHTDLLGKRCAGQVLCKFLNPTRHFSTRKFL
ncbi:hypothetical protein E2C01_056164 [Portunus trituberculatus]|uniref:Uncharacterized protein n=1 Tax=Portunus trituberculatus TaxID=210409 RepID=A0A5B7GWM2_PORTR|nr:hypothetical protein [Portunus trituberculatus]